MTVFSGDCRFNRLENEMSSSSAKTKGPMMPSHFCKESAMNMKPTKKNFTSLVWAVVVLPILLAGVPARAQRPAPGKYTTIDFPGATDTAECCSAILNINNEGQIVGGYLDTRGNGHGFLLDEGHFTTIDFPGSIYTEALGINPQGRIVGEYLDAANVSHGFLLKQHVFRTIDFPGAVNSFVNWINSANDMVGGYMDAVGSFHGFLVRQGVSTSFDYPGASNTFGLGINARGEIVGIYLDSSALNAHGFLLSEGRFHTFDFPGANTNVAACGGFGGGVTYTAGINDEGVIVGGYCGADDHYRGFSFTGEASGESLESDAAPNPSAFRTINFPDAVNSFASGINSEGKIVGGYESADGHYHGFLLSNSEVDPLIAPSTTSQPNARPAAFYTQQHSQTASSATGLRQIGMIKQFAGSSPKATIDNLSGLPRQSQLKRSSR